jgi:DNA polymerase
MDRSGPPTQEELLRQGRQHLESLRLAGVEYLPRFSGELVAPPCGPEPAPVAAAATTLFSEDGAPAPAPAGPTPALSLDQRRQALEVLAQQVSTCTRCGELASSRTQTVFGVGRAGADLCFVGEAPGADEDAQGEPFVGAAGKLLDRIIIACGLKREDVYICNIIKCRPPGNRTPRPDEAGHCREYLEKQLDLVRPRFICALGSCAAQNLLNTTQSLGKLRGRLHSFRGIPVLVTYHPAYLLPHRAPEKKKDVWEDMKFLMARMGRPIGSSN